MKKQEKKKFNMPTQANMDGEYNIRNGLDAKKPYNEDDDAAGDSVDEHKELEAANEIIAEKVISQINNNS
ncbi:hypothetical protein [Virgibacillus ihumii]|uniref:hypothetical protein n=1 Tax=Virgibacillus ihumii TaxID=2686091 RepID=UPI00157C49A6|nr:hypothetical protein [Virgibacillus ihumii]